MQKSYCDLLDTLDGGYSEEPLELPSALPGLKRSVYLTSQAQLNNLVSSLSVSICLSALSIYMYTENVSYISTLLF